MITHIGDAFRLIECAFTFHTCTASEETDGMISLLIDEEGGAST